MKSCKTACTVNPLKDYNCKIFFCIEILVFTPQRIKYKSLNCSAGWSSFSQRLVISTSVDLFESTLTNLTTSKVFLVMMKPLFFQSFYCWCCRLHTYNRRSFAAFNKFLNHILRFLWSQIFFHAPAIDVRLPFYNCWSFCRIMLPYLPVWYRWHHRPYSVRHTDRALFWAVIPIHWAHRNWQMQKINPLRSLALSCLGGNLITIPTFAG